MPKLLHMQVKDLSGGGAIYFNFDRLIHRGDSDYVVFKRNWLKTGFRTETTELGVIVATALMQDGTGVGAAELRSYVVMARDLSSAVSSDYVIMAVKDVLRKNGYTLIEQPRQPGSPYQGFRVSELDSPVVCAWILWRSIRRATGDLTTTAWRRTQHLVRVLRQNLLGAAKNFLGV